MTKLSSFMLPTESTAPESVSDGISPSPMIENGAGNISLATPFEDEFSMFFLNPELVQDIEALKASANERGDKKAEALAIASLSFYRFINNRNAVVGAIKKWIGQIERNAIIKNFSFIRQENESLATHIHSKCKWRALKQGPEAVRLGGFKNQLQQLMFSSCFSEFHI